MNGIIKKIAEESGIYIAYENMDVSDKELEFFAEKIILECCKVIDGHYEPVYDGSILKQHFGVE